MSALDLVTLEDVQAAQKLLSGVVRHTPLEPSRPLTAALGGPAWLKCENLQRAGSYKVRGAYVRIARLAEAERARGVVAASAGNHAQGVALAASILGTSATVFMPVGAALPKVAATKGYGARVQLTGASIDEALVAAQDQGTMTVAESRKHIIDQYAISDVQLRQIEEEGLENVFARHRRLASATRACVRHWAQGGGPEIYALDADAASDSLTAVLVPAGHDADRVRTIAFERYGVALGRGLAALQGRVFRIGHMGDLNEPMLLGALGAIELALAEAGVPHARGGIDAAMDTLRVPAASRSRRQASSTDSRFRYGRSVVIAWNASQTSTIRDSSGMSPPALPSG